MIFIQHQLKIFKRRNFIFNIIPRMLNKSCQPKQWETSKAVAFYLLRTHVSFTYSVDSSNSTLYLPFVLWLTDKLIIYSVCEWLYSHILIMKWKNEEVHRNKIRSLCFEVKQSTNVCNFYMMLHSVHVELILTYEIPVCFK